MNQDLSSPRPTKIPAVPGILTSLVVVMAVLGFPGFVNFFYRQGAGRAFFELMDSKNLPWASMTQVEQAPYMASLVEAGLKSAIFMAMGQWIPWALFLVIVIWLLTPSITRRFRMFLRLAFWIIWTLGTIFFAIGSGYWGQAPQFQAALLPAIIIYIFVAAVIGLIIYIGRLIQRFIGFGAKP